MEILEIPKDLSKQCESINNKFIPFSILVGKTINKIESYRSRVGTEIQYLLFEITDFEKYIMFHEQGCCEWVYLNDICGDLEDLIGTPILMAEEVSRKAEELENEESATWTFYKLATIKGYVTLRWLGVSNGYYSESVDFRELK